MSSGTPEKSHSLNRQQHGTASLPSLHGSIQAHCITRKNTAFPKQSQGRLRAPGKPLWTCTLGPVGKGVWQVAITEYMYFLRKNTKKSSRQGEQRKKRWPHCPLYAVRPWHWETLGHLGDYKDHLQSAPGPRFQSNHSPPVSIILQAFITDKNCSLGALCVCLGGRTLEEWEL